MITSLLSWLILRIYEIELDAVIYYWMDTIEDINVKQKPVKSTKCWCCSNAYSSSSWDEFQTWQLFLCCYWDMYLPPTQTSLLSISNTRSEWPGRKRVQTLNIHQIQTILTPSSDGWYKDLAQTLGELSTSDPRDRRCWQPHTCSSSWTSLDKSATIVESCSVRQTLAIFCR